MDLAPVPLHQPEFALNDFVLVQHNAEYEEDHPDDDERNSGQCGIRRDHAVRSIT